MHHVIKSDPKSVDILSCNAQYILHFTQPTLLSLLWHVWWYQYSPAANMLVLSISDTHPIWQHHYELGRGQVEQLWNCVVQGNADLSMYGTVTLQFFLCRLPLCELSPVWELLLCVCWGLWSAHCSLRQQHHLLVNPGNVSFMTPTSKVHTFFSVLQ